MESKSLHADDISNGQDFKIDYLSAHDGWELGDCFKRFSMQNYDRNGLHIGFFFVVKGLKKKSPMIQRTSFFFSHEGWFAEVFWCGQSIKKGLESKSLHADDISNGQNF